MADSLYANAVSAKVSTGGGVVQTTCVAVSTGAQCNGGTSIPCRTVMLNVKAGGNAAGVTCALNPSTVAAISLGVYIPAASTGGYLEIPIDNVNKLWFAGTAGDLVNLTYRN
jgi:hypothetical protein